MSIVNEADIQKLILQDSIFGDIHNLYGPPPNWKRDPGFISLCRIILEQQVSLASARAHFLKLEGYVKEITPKSILALTDDELRQCQISRQKTIYLRELSTEIQSGQLDLDALSDQSEPDVRSALTAIKGIGQWTCDIYLMFCMQVKDIIPLGDVAIINAIQDLFSVSGKENILLLSERWAPLRTLASFYLWHHYLKTRNRKAVDQDNRLLRLG